MAKLSTQNYLEQKAFILGVAKDALSTHVDLSGYANDTDQLCAALERPKDESHGDWSITLALRAAKELGQNPRAIGEAIVQALTTHLTENHDKEQLIETVELAGPGFVNITLSSQYHCFFVEELLAKGADFAKPNSAYYTAKQINLEFVSANPTGPLHIGHGRWAAIGNALGNILEYCGHIVHREYYINDAGGQVEKFGQSLKHYIDEAKGVKTELPVDGYGGEYVKELAATISNQVGGHNECGAELTEQVDQIAQLGLQAMLADIKGTLELQKVQTDTWFSEKALISEGKVEQALQQLQQSNFVYEQEGATWLKTSDFGDDKDRVLVKANGENTYFLSDIAYHLSKLDRGSQQLINIWGADHHGYVARLQAALAMAGQADKLEVLLGQLVNLLRNGQPVKMSKRTGEMVTLRELLDEVGADAVNFIMLSRSLDQPIEFDIEEAKRQDSTNPVYYVQYAHARICSILQKAGELHNLDKGHNGVRPQLHSCEIGLIKQLERAGETIETAAIERAPHKLVHYAQELAKRFHHFYTECRIIEEDNQINADRLQLARATQTVLALMLRLLGISAPEQM